MKTASEIRKQESNIPFKRAILKITRKTSETKALPAFRSMLRLDYRPPNPWIDVERVLQDCLEVWREQGFTPDEVDGLRQRYQALPRRGLRPTKRAREKE